MKLSLRKVMVEAVESYSTMPRHEWVLAWPGQVVLASGTIHWSAEVTTVPSTLLLLRIGVLNYVDTF